MATTRTVTGTVLKPDGTVYTDWAVKFTLLAEIISDGDLIPRNTVEITTDSNGDFSTTLAVPDSGTAYYNLRFQTGYSRDFNLSGGSSIGLNEIISIATVASDPNYITELTSLKITHTDVDLQITAADEYIRCDGTFEVTLPATTGSGDVYFIANIGTGTITPVVTGSDTINGTTPLTIPTMTIAYYVDAVAGNWDSNW
jgi:hypothetical protein